jgi:hypothetical protein
MFCQREKPVSLLAFEPRIIQNVTYTLCSLCSPGSIRRVQEDTQNHDVEKKNNKRRLKPREIIRKKK